MKTKQTTSSKSNKASAKALLQEAASKLPNKVLFKDKVERAKSYLKQADFSSPKSSI
ncbi:MAG: hypothetical protein J7621_27595 [Niastella sp.]|nr:hypothetical protein [Niastella sp.]